ncbi:MAG: transglutaminase-like domain-containing protein [Treponema sp.]|nr:transglutaminase-like domain-containing protein [Treponema sp.]
MKKLPLNGLTALFILRLFFYLSVAGLPALHPGISVSYDRIGIVQWFLIVPFEALIAFLPAPGGRVLTKLIIALPPLFVLSVYAGGLGMGALAPFCAGLLSFVLSFLLFHYPRWGKASILEPFFLAWVCFRLLSFSRSGEDMAGRSMGLTQIILVWTMAVFLLHSVVVYFCLYPHGLSGSGREGAIFALASAVALALVIFVLPADFIRNRVIVNLLSDRIDEKTKPDDNDWGIPKNGGGRRNNRGTIPGDETGREPGLRGLSEYDWPSEEGEGRGRNSRGRNGRGNGEGESQQYTVMVVASKREPVYMGNSFRGLLDPVRGFLPSPEENLNRLPSLRLFNTWFDNSPVFDRGREREEVFSLSALSQNFLPYRPFAVEPTILSEGSGPLRYMHRVVSDMFTGDPLGLAMTRLRDLNPQERRALAPYLELHLEEEDRAVFGGYLEQALEDWRTKRGDIIGDNGYLSGILPRDGAGKPGEAANEYLDKILAILLSFRDYQYNVSNDDDSSVSALKRFLLSTKDGDCVEFSNTLALLGRLAGIPSRVVTGYLAAGSLQTMAHLRGLAALRSKIKVLQEFPFEDLYLVTDAHSHSWTQFYIPSYGWIDFEATAFAIPPIGFGDANIRDVVIPLIDETQVFAPVRAFPWRAVLRTLLILGVTVLLCAYAVRYGREIALRLGARRPGRAGARSLYLLLLARLAADGKPIKPASKTAVEYSQIFPASDAVPADSAAGSPFAGFAALYSELRWREFKDPGEQDERSRQLRQEYRNIIVRARRPGFRAFLIRIFSLRGLAYL